MDSKVAATFLSVIYYKDGSKVRLLKNSTHFFNLNEDAGHVVGAASVTVWRVDVLANDLVEHVLHNLRVLLGRLPGLNAFS